MKKISLIFAIAFAASALFAEAPELKNMMPNSWQKLTRLCEQEENEFLNQQLVKEDLESTETESWAISKFLVKEKRVYKETANNVDFYRVLACNYNMDDFFNAVYQDTNISEKDYEKYIHQSIRQTIYVKQESRALYKLRSLESKVYGIAEGNMETEGCEYFIFHDFMIKELNKDETGFFMTEASIGYQAKKDSLNIAIEYCRLKDQLCGSSSCQFLRVKKNEDYSKAISDYERRIKIDASDYLLDSKCPLKYSIQNAFDGNPATSYVENTENDLIRIYISAEGVFEKIRLINGYAKNKDYYYANNRIKCVANEFDNETGEIVKWGQKVTEKNERFSVEDGLMTYQTIIYFTNGYFFVSDIYKGNNYNDTCIAELDFYSKKGNWIFGEINE